MGHRPFYGSADNDPSDLYNDCRLSMSLSSSNTASTLSTLAMCITLSDSIRLPTRSQTQQDLTIPLLLGTSEMEQQATMTGWIHLFFRWSTTRIMQTTQSIAGQDSPFTIVLMLLMSLLRLRMDLCWIARRYSRTAFVVSRAVPMVLALHRHPAPLQVLRRQRPQHCCH